MKKNNFLFLRHYLWFLLLMALLPACEKEPLKQAFNGEYSIGKNNKIINEYCQSCHVHARFVPDNHIDEMNLLYNSRLFRTTNQCRTCHYLEENILGDTLRRHRRPDAVAKGRFKDFIQEEWARRKERKQAAD